MKQTRLALAVFPLIAFTPGFAMSTPPPQPGKGPGTNDSVEIHPRTDGSVQHNTSPEHFSHPFDDFHEPALRGIK